MTEECKKGNLQYQKFVADAVDNFFAVHGEKSPQDQYFEIWNQYNNFAWNDFHSLCCASAILGEWIIKTQGGERKMTPIGNRDNSFVLVSPYDRKCLKDVKEIVKKRCRTRANGTSKAYKQDSKFWNAPKK